MAVDTTEGTIGQSNEVSQAGATATALPPVAVPVPGGSGVLTPAPAGESGIYVYCVVEEHEPKVFGKIGIGGRGDEVYTIHYKDLAAVVSRTPLVVYDPTRENVLAHEHVNEVSIEDGFTPVPMSFGTLFKTEKDIVE